jgi:hypothetical protein
VEAHGSEPEKDPGKPGAGGKKKVAADPDGNPFSGAAAADAPAKIFALVVLFGGLAYCLLIAGLAEFSHNVPFETEANFALFAAFIVVAGAIERFIQPLTSILPPFTKKDDAASNADRTLVSYGIALIVGIAVSSCFGLYFLETVGVEIGMEKIIEGTPHWVFEDDGEKLLRGLDVFITALIITGGTKPLHDMITSIEKKKDTLKKGAADAL